MDKNAIKKFAVWARRELIARVSQKAEQYGITEKHIGDLRAESVDGRLLTSMETAQRDALIHHIRQNGYQQVMEEVAYTWFNRFCALRFMEVNNYLPTRIRVFTDEENAFKPQILTEAIHMEMDGLDMDKVYQFKSDNKTEELYKYLLITQCNALYSILPGMFQQIADYTELLLPDNLLREGSVIEQMISLIPEEDWLVPEDHDKDSIQIIGWLYQYYNAEPKDQVFANLKKNIKISKHDIPAATQLFTPDWIVRYMVENSLGRLWVEGHPDDELKAGWKYYLEEAEQEQDVQVQLAKIREEYAAIKPEDIKCIDPCMGSGHILVYMFDVLVQIYQAYGYSTREAVQSIVENNLYGLDIDDRAAQLAYFAVMMKARQYDRRFFSRGIQPHVCAIQESTKMPEDGWAYFGAEQDIARRVYAAFVDAKEYGSLIEPNVTLEELDALDECLIQNRVDLDLAAEATWITACNIMFPLVKQARMLVQKYAVVVTNPPYMNLSNASQRFNSYAKEFYSKAKADLFSVFIQKCLMMCLRHGYYAAVTMQSWMFLSSFDEFRKEVLQNNIISLLQIGYNSFPELNSKVAQAVAFVMNKVSIAAYIGKYFDLNKMYPQNFNKEEAFFDTLYRKRYYLSAKNRYASIPGSPIAYWVSNSIASKFKNELSIADLARVSEGIKTGDNERFLRYWHEVDCNDFSMGCATTGYKWYPHHKGGEFHKWYGNLEWVINWQNDGKEIKSFANSGLQGQDMYFKTVCGSTKVSSRPTTMRYYQQNVLFDSGAPSIMANDSTIYIMSLMNSAVGIYILNLLNPTLGLQVGDIKKIPVVFGDREKVEALARTNIELCRTDWNSYETSWDFICHPIVQKACSCTHWNADYITIEECFNAWQSDCETRFQQLKANEEELNRIFIEIYGLQDELTPAVEDKDVTVRLADLSRDIRSFISYAVGCMFGRYSLDKPGLILAGQPYAEKFAYASVPITGTGVCGGEAEYRTSDCYLRDEEKLIRCTYAPDRDGILPISDDDYFNDDIVARFVRFVEVVFGKDTLEENLAFIAKALGGSGTSRDVIRSYFLNDFYADHLKIYQKRPIYWLFDSGKKNGFKALIYMHRYAPDTIARIRTDYVHEQQSRYRTAIADLENRIISASTSERVKLNKQLTKVKAQDEELRLYEEKIHHLADQMISIDLDDGVKVNYAKFADVLAKIK